MDNQIKTRRVVSASLEANALDRMRQGLSGLFDRQAPFTTAAEDLGLSRDEYVARRAQSLKDTRDARRLRASVEWAQEQARPAPDTETAAKVNAFVTRVLSHKGVERRAFVECEAASDPSVAAFAAFIPGAFGEWARAIVRARTHVVAPVGRNVVIETRDPNGTRKIRNHQTR